MKLVELVKTYSFGKWGYAEVQVFKDENGKYWYRVVNMVTNVEVGIFDNWNQAKGEARYIAERYDAIERQMYGRGGW